MGGYSTDLTTPAIWTQEFLDLSDSLQRYLTDKLTVCCCPHSKIRTSHGLFRMPFSLHLWTLNICSLDTETALLRTKDRMSKMEQDRVLKMYNCVRFVSSDLSLDNLVRYQRMAWHVAWEDQEKAQSTRKAEGMWLWKQNFRKTSTFPQHVGLLAYAVRGFPVTKKYKMLLTKSTIATIHIFRWLTLGFNAKTRIIQNFFEIWMW